MSSRHLEFAGYGIGSIGNGIYNTVPGLLLMFYMTNTLGVPVTLATIALFAPKIIDVVTDPFMGTLSDRTRSRWGRRRPYLAAGICTLPPLFALMFSAPAFEQPLYSFHFVTAIYILCTLAYTTFAVPYVAMSAEIPSDYHERTTVNGYRMAFVMVGLLVSGALAPTIVDLGGGGRDGYRLMSTGLAIIICLSWLPPLLTTGHVRDPQTLPDIAFFGVLKDVARNAPFVRLLVTYIIQLTAMSCCTATLAYYVTYIMDAGMGLIATLFVVLNLTALVAMPLWVTIGRRVGKLNCLYLASLLLATSYFALLFFSAESPQWLFLLVVAMAGIGTGGQQLFAFSMLADTIVHGNLMNGHASEAVYSGFFTASEKVGAAAGTLVAGTLFGLAGLIETTEGAIAQPDSAITGIRIAFSIAPAALILLSLLILAGYRAFEGQQLQNLLAEEA